MTNVKVRDPGRRVGTMTTFELRDLRRELEHALAAFPGGHPNQTVYTERLAQVTAEEESRFRSVGVPIVP